MSGILLHLLDLLYILRLDLSELPVISSHAEMAQQAQTWVLDFRWQGHLVSLAY